jgi:hypothetical protein
MAIPRIKKCKGSQQTCHGSVHQCQCLCYLGSAKKRPTQKSINCINLRRSYLARHFAVTWRVNGQMRPALVRLSNDNTLLGVYCRYTCSLFDRKRLALFFQPSHSRENKVQG